MQVINHRYKHNYFNGFEKTKESVGKKTFNNLTIKAKAPLTSALRKFAIKCVLNIKFLQGKPDVKRHPLLFSTIIPIMV